ncbi:MAG: ABC transporter substrate-binding protein [Bacilli bacterium]
MKRVFKLFVLLFIMTILCGCSKDENELIMGTEAGFAPYEYYDNNEIVGVDIDIAKEIAKELNKNLVVKDVAFDSIINEVKSGKADFGAAGISYNEERAKQVDFSINYTVSKQVVIVRKDSSIKSVKDVNNQKIAVQLGSVADTLLTKDYPKVTLVREKKYLAAIQDLKDSKVDAVVMDELPAKEMIKNNNSLNILDGALAEDSYGMVVKKGNKELLDVINGVLERLVKNGKIDSFILKKKL